jgi:hypothetical protein
VTLRRSRAAAALVASLAFSTSAATAASGSAGIGVRLLPEQGASTGDPLAHSYIVGLVAPGSVIRRRIEVGNSTRRGLSLAIYPGAARIRQGSFAFAAGRRRNELARWTKLSSQMVNLPPGTKTSVTVTIRIPSTAAPGERYAVVWAQSTGAPSGGVRLVNRVGVRLYLTIGPGGTSPASFAIGSLRATRSRTGTPVVSSTIRNGGRRTLLLSGELSLSQGPGGTRAGPFRATLVGALSPGGARQLRVQLGHGLPRGPWSARLWLHSGQIARSRTTTVRFPHAPPALRSVNGVQHGLLIALLASILAAASVSAFVVFRAANLRRSGPVSHRGARGAP